MSTWTTPATWSNGAVTAATMNVEIRDHLNFLKGALDLLTASTSADTGTTMYLDVRRTNATDPALRGGVSGAANPEFQIDRNGRLWWGAGGGSAVDVSLRRGSSTQLLLTGTADPKLEVQLSALGGATTSFMVGSVSGDSVGRMSVRVRSDGGGILEFGDGTSAKGSLYWDVGNTQVVLSMNATGATRVVSPAAYGFGVSSAPASGAYFATSDPGTGGQIQLSGDSGATLRRNTTGRLETVGRLGTVDGLALKVKSGAVSDGDFSYSAESGLIALDTGGFLYVREGSTWRFIETRGMMMLVGPFTWANLAASSTDLAGDIGGLGGGTGARYVSPYAGDIVGFSARGSTTCSAGTATFRGIIISTNTTGSVVINSTTDTQYVYGVQATGIDVVAAGDRLGMGVTTTAGFTPTGSTEYAAWLHLLVRRR